MNEDTSIPEEVQINAWTGTEAPVSGLAKPSAWASRASRKGSAGGKLAPAEIDLRQWQNEDVGWGIILPDDETIPANLRHTAAGAPDCIQQLVTQRGDAPVFRFNAAAPTGFLFRYDKAGNRTAPLMDAGAKRGRRTGDLPWYLLIVGGPDIIPWWVQYHLNLIAFTGRLALSEPALENYVAALMTNWRGSAARRQHPVIWSVDQGQPDITWLMTQTVANELEKSYIGDAEVGATKLKRLTKEMASGSALATALAAETPALIVTTSHGKTGPIASPGAMLEQLGVLVDANGVALEYMNMLGQWSPDGAIWYAHACCSAGSDSTSRFVDLVPAGTSVQRVLAAVAALGAHVAPMPTALLGASKPLKAFIGHVEPTFDWTLRDTRNKQVLTSGIVSALYSELFLANPVPVGMAFRSVFSTVAGQQNIANLKRAEAVDLAKREAATKEMVRAQLLAHDRQNIVILGDPTVALPTAV